MIYTLAWKLPLLTLVALMVMGLTLGPAFAASGSGQPGDDRNDVRCEDFDDEEDDQNEQGNGICTEAKLELISNVPGATGEVELELVNSAGIPELQASAKVEGLAPNDLFSLCVDGVHVDHEEAEDQGKVEFDDNIVSPRVTLEGMHVTINEGVGCSGPTVMHAIVRVG